MMTRFLNRARRANGQSLIEFAIVLPLLIMLALGVVEVSYALLDQHVVTRLSREGANLISRDVSLEAAARALSTMSSRPVDITRNSRVIFSVIKKGATTGTNNYDRDILYQRHAYGALTGVQSALRTSGNGSYRGAPDYEAVNSDNDTSLRVTNLPTNLTIPRGGMLYVTEIYATHTLLTPLGGFGIPVPERLYSISYF